ncbi:MULTISPECIES: YcnI family copper-binding membrane protein [unclassified Paenibacillus]|uniref:YcnI family copper-binding membrane protein n=1 Tax=unclassified Paenibacillus TaxID=185978 RepID=UPI00363404B3
MKKTSRIILFCLLFSMIGAGVASAHVTVLPKEAVQGSYEKFAVRVPSEKDIPTVKVEVKFPLDAVSVSRFEPKPGWKYELTKDASGKITGVIWTATGEGLSSTEFGEFYMQGKVADAATAISWKAYQTYKDGSVVEWVGADGSDKPASVTKVTPKPSGATADSHGNTNASTPAAAAGDAAKAGTAAAPAMQNQSQTPLYLSIAALLLGLVSLLIALSKRKAAR